MWPIVYTAIGSLLIVAGVGGAALFLVRRRGVRPALLGWGALCFAASQVVHLPGLMVITAAFKPLAKSWSPHVKLGFNAVVLGLAAGLCEELARWLFLRHPRIRPARWVDALGFGLGHGGVEALLVALLAPVQAAVMLLMGDQILAKLASSPEQAAAVRQQVEAMRHLTALTGLIPAWERAMAVVLHLALTLVVWEAVRRSRPALVAVAVLWHALVDGLAVLGMQTGFGVLRIELAMTAATVLSVAVILATRRLEATPPLPAAPTTGS